MPEELKQAVLFLAKCADGDAEFRGLLRGIKLGLEFNPTIKKNDSPAK